MLVHERDAQLGDVDGSAGGLDLGQHRLLRSWDGDGNPPRAPWVRDRVAWLTLTDMRRRALTCVLAGLALALTACGAATTSLGAGEQASVSTEVRDAGSLAGDLRPLHAEAVELADLVLDGGPSAQVAEVVQAVRQQQQDLLADVDSQLAGAAALPTEAGTLAVAELQVVRGAVGDEAVRLGLDGLLQNHLSAVNRAKAAVTEGATGDERVLADRVLEQQGAALQELSALS